jgi:hypothetical protein
MDFAPSLFSACAMVGYMSLDNVEWVAMLVQWRGESAFERVFTWNCYAGVGVPRHASESGYAFTTGVGPYLAQCE